MVMVNWQTRLYDPEEATLLLHDSWIELDTISKHEDSVRMLGVLEKLTSNSFNASYGRFTFALQVRRASEWKLEDEAQIGVLLIDEVYAEGNQAIVIAGVIPVRLFVYSADSLLQITVAEDPYETKRFLRWKPMRPPEWPNNMT
jgi:hypothetical protein